jgi:hypothetical protein
MLTPLFGLGQQGKSPNVTGQRRVNLYAEIQPEEDKTRVAYYPTPGLSLFTHFGDTPIRGLYTVTISDIVYVVHRSTLYALNNAAIASALGALSTSSGQVAMVDDGTRILMVDGVGGYYWDTSSGTFSTIVDPDFPAGATTCAFLAGRMIANDPASPGRFRWSDLYATTWPALNFATAEASPDALVAVFVVNGQLLLLGELTLEWWATSGDPNLPYAPVGGAVIEWGLAARRSVVKYGSTCAFLARNKQGQVQVVQMQGYMPQVISTPEVDTLINAYSAVEDATAIAYMLGGHPMYEISFPVAGKSWLYDGLSNAWSELTSGTTGGRHVAAIGVNWLNKTRLTDYATGALYTLEPAIYTDAGAAIVRKIVGKHQFDQAPFSVAELWVDMEMGVGIVSGQGSDPRVILRTSKDGGHTWSNEVFAGIGAQGIYQRRAVWRRLGRARDWLFEISLSDPVKSVFVGAFMDAVK